MFFYILFFFNLVGGHLYIDLNTQASSKEFEAKCDELADRINAVKVKAKTFKQHQDHQHIDQQHRQNDNVCFCSIQ